MPRKPKKPYPYFEKHPDYGTYYAFYVDAAGQRRRRSLKTRDQVVAAARFTKLLKDVDRGVLGFSRIPTRFPLEEAGKRFLKEGAGHLSAATVKRHEGALRLHLVPYFKRTPFKAISPKKVLGYVRHRQKEEAAPNTIHKELAALSAVFNFAMQEEWVQANPVLAIKKPRLEVKNPFYVPTLEEIEKILPLLRPKSRRFFLAICNTGCRLNEVCKLNVQDADLERRLLRVVRKGSRIDFVPINETLLEVIQEELDERPDAKDDEPLFVNQQGNRFRGIRKPLETACEKLSLPHITHHGLRHAYATILLDEGVELEKISKLLGHTTTKITEEIYLHWKARHVRKASEVVQIGGKD